MISSDGSSPWPTVTCRPQLASLLCMDTTHGSRGSAWQWLRGGMLRSRDEDNPTRYTADLEKAMMFWAHRNIQSDAPSALGATTTMLLKAEARTIAALMNSKSPAQRRRILTAAYRRAALPDPSEEANPLHMYEHVHERSLDKVMEHLDGLRIALQNQVTITQEIASVLAEVLKAQAFAPLRNLRLQMLMLSRLLRCQICRLEREDSKLGAALPAPADKDYAGEGDTGLSSNAHCLRWESTSKSSRRSAFISFSPSSLCTTTRRPARESLTGKRPWPKQ